MVKDTPSRIPTYFFQEGVNFCLIKYEDLLSDPINEFSRVADHCGIKNVSIRVSSNPREIEFDLFKACGPFHPTNFKHHIFDCCKQSLTRLLLPSIHPPTHPLHSIFCAQIERGTKSTFFISHFLFQSLFQSLV